MLPSQHLIDDALAEVQRSPTGDLSASQRLRIYATLNQEGVTDQAVSSFQTVNDWLALPAYRRYVRLCILTAQYVLPVFDQAWSDWPEYERALPYDILACTEAVMNHTAKKRLVARVMDDAYLFRGNSGTSLATDLALEALEETLGLTRGHRFNPFKLPRQDLEQVSAERGIRDVPALVAQAVSIIEDGSSKSSAYQAPTYYPQRRRAFWEWWLQSAVPSVWREDITVTFKLNKASLLGLIHAIHNDLLGFWIFEDDENIEADCLYPAAEGYWSVKDILAHMVYWEQWVVAELEAVAAGEIPHLISYEERLLLNEQNYQANRYRVLYDIRADLERSMQAMVATVSALDDHILESLCAWTDEGSIAQHIANAFNHWYEHMDAMEKWHAHY